MIIPILICIIVVVIIIVITCCCTMGGMRGGGGVKEFCDIIKLPIDSTVYSSILEKNPQEWVPKLVAGEKRVKVDGLKLWLIKENIYYVTKKGDPEFRLDGPYPNYYCKVISEDRQYNEYNILMNNNSIINTEYFMEQKIYRLDGNNKIVIGSAGWIQFSVMIETDVSNKDPYKIYTELLLTFRHNNIELREIFNNDLKLNIFINSIKGVQSLLLKNYYYTDLKTQQIVINCIDDDKIVSRLIDLDIFDPTKITK